MAGELAHAVCQVMARCTFVPKTGKNSFHKYTYASDADLLTVLQPLMAEAGLVLLPHKVETHTVEHNTDRKGKPQWRTELTVTYLLLHTSGETMQVQAPGCGVDGEDKGVYKAMTGALKYALRHLFLVPVGDRPPPKRNAPPAPHPDDQPSSRPCPGKRRGGQHHMPPPPRS